MRFLFGKSVVHFSGAFQQHAPFKKCANSSHGGVGDFLVLGYMEFVVCGVNVGTLHFFGVYALYVENPQATNFGTFHFTLIFLFFRRRRVASPVALAQVCFPPRALGDDLLCARLELL